jgi:metallo-beta-lactamase family protein
VLVCESTYGNRLHVPLRETLDKLYSAINRTIERDGKVLIPAFSFGRTQLVIHFLQEGILSGKIPRVPIYVDSPLAADITDVYYMHPECLNEQARQRMKRDGILGGDLVEYVREFEDSMRIALRPEPMILVASSGMCDAGRILHHLKLHVDDPRCCVILVSYQAQGTTGRRLMEKSPTVRFLGREWNKWLEVIHLEGFSAHADLDDFREYLLPIAPKVGKVRLIHGERDQAEALADEIRGMGCDDVEVPQPGDLVTVE